MTRWMGSVGWGTSRRHRTWPVAVALLGGVMASLLVITPGPAAADSTWVVRGPAATGSPSSPSSSAPLEAVVRRGDDGAVTLGVTRGGAQVMVPAPIGIRTRQADLTRGLSLRGRTDREVVEHYTTRVGKRLSHSAWMTETRFAFEGTGGARVDLVVRVARDGVAYRYVLPYDLGAVLGEASSFTFPTDAPAWLATYLRYYETPYVATTAGGAATGEYGFPLLYQVDDNYVLLTESDVDGSYSGARLVHAAEGSGTYQIKLWDPEVAVDGPLTTPWRTMIIGDLATVTESTLVDDLAPPSRVADTSWIRPGVAVWSWLNGGRSAQQDLARQKEFVDYAAARGWSYVTLDAGWYDDPNWRTTSWVPELVEYAKARRVGIFVWMRFSDLDTAAKRATMLPLVKQWGVDGLKIDFMDSDAQERYRWYDEVLAETARLRLMVDFHGSTIPHGIYRTWPQVVTMEAIYGAEKSSGPGTAHLTTVPFTRNVVGSMDYTPEAFQRTTRATSDGQELALSVLFESGLGNFAGSPESYDARPEARWFLEQVPTVWDDTRLLTGSPGEGAVIARRDRDRWFIGGGFAGAARTVEVPMDLPAGRWLVEVVRDGAAGLVRERQVVQAGERLSVDVAKEGGFAAIACRWSPRRTTCAGPVEGAPATSVSVSPGTTDLTPGASYSVSGEFRNADDAPLRDVTLAPRAPDGWRVEGDPVRVDRLDAGQTVRGAWRVTAAADPVVGYTAVPVVASFHAAFDRSEDPLLESEQVTLAHVWRPLGPGETYVSDRPVLAASNGAGPVETDRSNGESAAGDGATITLGGVRHGKGIGMAAPGQVSVALDGRCGEFTAEVGVEDEVDGRVDRAQSGGTVGFVVEGDGEVLAQTGTLTSTGAAERLTVDVRGVDVLTLRLTDGGDGTSLDHGSWGDARLRCANS